MENPFDKAQDKRKTTDTALASYLITEGLKLVFIDYSGPRYEYTFDQSIADLAGKYISGHALTDPSDLIKVNKKLLRVIKKRIQWEED